MNPFNVIEPAKRVIAAIDEKPDLLEAVILTLVERGDVGKVLTAYTQEGGHVATPWTQIPAMAPAGTFDTWVRFQLGNPDTLATIVEDEDPEDVESEEIHYLRTIVEVCGLLDEDESRITQYGWEDPQGVFTIEGTRQEAMDAADEALRLKGWILL